MEWDMSFFWPVHEPSIFQGLGMSKNESCFIAERIVRRWCYLQSSLAVNHNQTKRLADMVTKLVR